ncbi:MAG: beta-lactamase family protein [Pyrinomonadaceae bacterium]|nr:beta-lactamase family protein [Pyrinomonadaceae bacterium]
MKTLSKILLIAFAMMATVSAQSSSDIQARRQTEKVDLFVREKMKSKNIPGLSLAVVRDGKIILAKGYGMANLELNVPATKKTNYSIASITKTFTALATMMLVETGKISLEDPISKHFSNLPAAWNAVTVRQLLNHTSGISSFTTHEKIPCPVGKDVRDYNQTDVLKEVACLPLDFAPGERWLYGDTGYYLLGMLIEKVSGKTYEQFLRERMFTPLRMSDTRLISYTELIPNRADGYNFQNGSFRHATRFEINEFSNAGLVSTVLDMAKLDAALYTEKLLKRATLNQMWTSAKLNNGEIVASYGLGFGLTPYQGRRRVGHSGGGGLGFATAFTRFVDDKVTVIVLSNADQEGFTISEMANEIAAFYFPQSK